MLIENKSNLPVKSLTVGVLLDTRAVQMIYSPAREFGTSDTGVNLIPGQDPKGLSIDRGAYAKNPTNQAEREALLEAIKTPIKLKLKWRDGLEFLEINPADVRYEGFAD